MTLVSTFVDLVQQVSWGMTGPTFHSFLIVVTGWAFACRRTVTEMIVAAGAQDIKHHSAFHRVFAAAGDVDISCRSIDAVSERRRSTIGLVRAA